MMFGRLLIISIAYFNTDKLPVISPDIVTVNVTEAIVYVGESAEIEIVVNVKDGYHIQSSKVNDEFLIPTTLEISNNEFLSIDKQEFPTSKQFQLEGSDSLLQVYDGKFLIRLFVSPVDKIKTGKYALSAILRYQACDSKRCFFPRVINFSIPVKVTDKK